MKNRLMFGPRRKSMCQIHRRIHGGATLADQNGDTAKSQSDKFKDAARAAECDENEARWTKRLKNVATAKPHETADA